MYVRLFSEILNSSLMDASVEARWLFVTMLILGDESQDGIVDMPITRLASHAALTVEQTRLGLAELMNPDPNSASREREGKRVIPLHEDIPERGWMIVNWAKYKAIAREEARREQARKDSAAYRERQKEISLMRQKPSAERQEDVRSTSGTTESESKAESETEEETEEEEGVALEAPSAPSASSGFHFQVAGKGPKTWFVPVDLLEDLRKLYPGVDINHELEKAEAKIRTRAVSKKTAKGMPKFLHSWMERAQNGARPQPGQMPVTEAAAIAPVGVMLTKNGAMMFRGRFFNPQDSDPSRWVSDGMYRPDGSHLQESAKDMALNREVWAEMNRLMKGA
jgi:hypothetical protein